MIDLNTGREVGAKLCKSVTLSSQTPFVALLSPFHFHVSRQSGHPGTIEHTVNRLVHAVGHRLRPDRRGRSSIRLSSGASRMFDPEKGVVERNCTAPNLRLRPVSTIRYHGMPSTRGLKADLMGTACLQLNLKKRAVGACFEGLPVEFGPFPLGMVGVNESRLPAGLGNVVDPRANATQRALNENQVLFLDDALSKLS